MGAFAAWSLGASKRSSVERKSKLSTAGPSRPIASVSLSVGPVYCLLLLELQLQIGG